MSQRNSPRDVGIGQSQGNTRPLNSDYQPQGEKFPTLQAAIDSVGRPTHQWSYESPYQYNPTWVLRYDKPDGSKSFQVITEFKGVYYLDLPRIPFPLYCVKRLYFSSTVYICEGELSAEAGQSIGLDTTTSLGGPFKAALTDWSPLAGTDVIVLRDFDEAGLQYAEEVAQLCLTAGACSAKIVTLPDLNEGEGLIEWIGGRVRPEHQCLQRAQIQAMRMAANCLARFSGSSINWAADRFSPVRFVKTLV